MTFIQLGDLGSIVYLSQAFPIFPSLLPVKANGDEKDVVQVAGSSELP